MAYTTLHRFTRPRTFLYAMTLRTGTELITLTLLINKLTGVYGILALFTGYHLSSLQLSMYIYSILALIVTATLAPHIRTQSPLHCLALAWFYLLDSLINALYTVAFGVSWFLVLARHTSPLHGSDSSTDKPLGPGGKMISDTAGFTDPVHNVSHVDVDGGGLVGHSGNANAASDTASAGGVSGALGSTILQSGGMASISVICALWAVRLYFVIVVMAYARGVLRQSIVAGRAGAGAPAAGPAGGERLSEESQAVAGQAEGAEKRKEVQEKMWSAMYFDDPFLVAEGWRGRLGRLLVRVPRGYWLGPELDEGNGDWMREVGGRFGRERKGGEGVPGVGERERRRRAGTGPPLLKPIELGKMRK